MIEQDIEYGCPYCGELNSVRVEPGAGGSQQFTTDCEVCCQPIRLRIGIDGDGLIDLDADQENG